MKRFWKDQNDYLSHAIQLEEQGNPVLMNMTMVAISALLIGFVVWASVTELNEIARTPGEVTSAGQSKTIQHSDGGTVAELLVHDGKAIEKGDVLLRLSDIGLKEDLARAQTRDTILAMEEERLRAGLAGRKPDFSRFRISEHVAQDRMRYAAAMNEGLSTEASVIRNQIMQKERTIQMLEEEKRSQGVSEQIASDIHSKRDVLNKQGYISNLKLTEARQNLSNIQAQMAAIDGKIAVIRAEISEGYSRIQALQTKRVETMSADLDKVVSERMDNAETMAKIKSRLAHLTVKATESGVIKGLAVNNVGDVVRSGETIMEIVPVDDELTVQVKIPPQYIGHVRDGQEVHVKFSSFDFSRYGYTMGSLHDISARTFASDKGERYYKARVKLASDHVGSDPHNRILPGMTVMAEIITGQKTIMSYLLKPVQNSFSTAFNER